MSVTSDAVVALCVNYLGPAARKFLERQTLAHMKVISFDAIQKSDLPELAKWINISGALIIDKAKAKELSEKIASL